MGQKIEYNAEDWESQDEITLPSLKSLQSDIILPDDFFETNLFEGTFEKQLPNKQSSNKQLANKQLPNKEVQEKSKKSLQKEPQQGDNKEFGISAFFNGKKFEIGQNDDHSLLSLEEKAFRRQVEDLFELLEMEKTTKQTGVVRIYQTDSSPYKPWRFH